MQHVKVIPISVVGIFENTSGVSRRQVQNIVESLDYIWNLHDKCNQISTDMPSIGSVICEINFEIQAHCEIKKNMCPMCKTNCMV